jgi:uncharacterized membrane protein
MARAEPRLDQPKAARALVPRPHYDPDAFGRFSEGIARFIGTARFLVIMTVFVVVWIGYNVSINLGSGRDSDYRKCQVIRTQQIRQRLPPTECPKPAPFDPYPFILLTLVLSLQASYAAPLILLAQTRQADRDRVSLEEDRDQYARALAEAEFLAREIAAVRIALGDVATRDFVRSELRDLLQEIADERSAETADDQAG